MRGRLIKKMAKMIDGIDLSESAVGDVLDLPSRDACLLMYEDWAVPEDWETSRRYVSSSSNPNAAPRTLAAARTAVSKLSRLRRGKRNSGVHRGIDASPDQVHLSRHTARIACGNPRARTGE